MTSGPRTWLQSTELRRWYGHAPDKYDEFARRYREELRSAPGRDEVARFRSLAKTKRVALVTATRDVEHPGAAVLRAVLST